MKSIRFVVFCSLIFLGMVLVLLTADEAEDGFIETAPGSKVQERIVIVENKLIFIMDLPKVIWSTKNP